MNGHRLGVLVAAAAVLGLWSCQARSAADHPPLLLERTIVLPGITGRIDHLALDAKRGRLFVAELGAGSVETIDIASGRSLGRINGLREPQGLGYLPERDELAVATGGDGTLRFYRAADLGLVASVKLGEDADNVRIDQTTGRVVVGFGSGALAIVDPPSHKTVSEVALPVHPEGFQIEKAWAYVNLPDAGRIDVVDIGSGRRLMTWPDGLLRYNFSLALDQPNETVATVFRFPARLAILDSATGLRRQALDTCGDADDVYFDHVRHRIYVICGAGAVDVFGASGRAYSRVGRIASRAGARTGFFAPQLDRLFVAARAHGPAPAAILVFRPSRP